jgi:hypothetical protein
MCSTGTTLLTGLAFLKDLSFRAGFSREESAFEKMQEQIPRNQRSSE